MIVLINHRLFLREALEEVGWIDEDTFQFYCADSDLAVKLSLAGYQIVGCKSALVEHFNHLKTGGGSYHEAFQCFLNKWWGAALPPKADTTYEVV